MEALRNIVSVEKVVREKKSSPESPGFAPGPCAGSELKDKDLRKSHRSASARDRDKLRRLTVKQKTSLTNEDESSPEASADPPASVAPQRTFHSRPQEALSADESRSSDDDKPLASRNKSGYSSPNRRKRIVFKARRTRSPSSSSGGSETERETSSTPLSRTTERFDEADTSEFSSPDDTNAPASGNAVDEPYLKDHQSFDASIPEPDASTDRTRDFMSQEFEEFSLESWEAGDDLPDSSDAKAREKTSPKPQNNEGSDWETEYHSDFDDYEPEPEGEPEEISDDEGRISEDDDDENSLSINKTPPLSLNVNSLLSPNPQRDEDSFWDTEYHSDNDAMENIYLEDVYETAPDDPVLPEPNTARTSESEPEEEPEENSNDDEGRISEDDDESSLPINRTPAPGLNVSPLPSPKPEYHSDDYAVENIYMEDVYERAQDDLVLSEPNAARTSESELEEEPEEHNSKTDYDSDGLSEKDVMEDVMEDVYERAQHEPESELEKDPEKISDSKAMLEENVLPLPSPKPQSDEDSFWGPEYHSDNYAMLDRYMEDVYDQAQNDLDSELEAEPEKISDNVVMLKDNVLPINKTPPLSLNSSPLPSPEPQHDEGSDCDSDLQSEKDVMEDVYESAQDEPESELEGEPEEISDDEGMPEEGKENGSWEELDTDSLEDLTQSSDTASDQLESAAWFMQELDSSSLDYRNTMKVQDILRAYARSVQKLKNKNSDLSDKVKQLETEKVDLNNSLDEVREIKPALQCAQLELQMEVDHLKHQLKQEKENQRQVIASHNATKDELRKTEEQHQLQVWEKQQMEVSLRNCELEMRTLVINMKQLEEHSATQELQAQELLAQELLAQDELLHKQQAVKEENSDLLKKTSTLQRQIQSLMAEQERLQANSRLKEILLLEENQTLKERLQNAERETKANSDANCGQQLTELRSELDLMTNRFETLEKEAESSRAHVAAAAQEAERWITAKADTEKSLQREKEKTRRLKDRLRADGARHREEVSALSLKLSRAEFENNRLEDDHQRVKLQLTEKELQVKGLEETVQRLETTKSTVEKDLKLQHERLKRKALKIREQKNDAESRLNQETNTNSELQKELDGLRTLVKTAEKRLRDQDTTGECNMNQNLQELVYRETLQRRQLEKDNSELREDLSSLKRSEQRRLDELQELRRKMDFAQREHSLTEERTRNELQHKLEANLLLQTQAASQKAQDQINAKNAASLRSRLELRVRELESEVSRGRSTTLDSLSQQDAIRTELETYKSMYSEENLLRKALEVRLERTNPAHPTHRLSGHFSGFGSCPSDSGENYRTKMKSELDRAITKELSSSTVHLTSRAALDPASLATQQYLDQLRRNYLI